jgi:hypothetical protein
MEQFSMISKHAATMYDNCRQCLLVLNDTINFHEKQAEMKTHTSEFRLVERQHQFTKWLEWTREQQIENSIATDQESANNVKFYVPQYVFLQLKPE